MRCLRNAFWFTPARRTSVRSHRALHSAAPLVRVNSEGVYWLPWVRQPCLLPYAQPGRRPASSLASPASSAQPRLHAAASRRFRRLDRPAGRPADPRRSLVSDAHSKPISLSPPVDSGSNRSPGAHGTHSSSLYLITHHPGTAPTGPTALPESLRYFVPAQRTLTHSLATNCTLFTERRLVCSKLNFSSDIS